MTRIPFALIAVLALTTATAAAQDARAVLHAVPGLQHNQNMLIAYLPKEKIVVEGDLFTPPAAGAAAPALNASNRTFRDTVQRLKLDIAQIASIHGRVASWDEFAKLFGPQTN
jgi:hypothetical protein